MKTHENMRKRRKYSMETWEIIQNLREKHGMTQDTLAQKLFVTRQAVSRWETGVSHSKSNTMVTL